MSIGSLWRRLFEFWLLLLDLRAEDGVVAGEDADAAVALERVLVRSEDDDGVPSFSLLLLLRLFMVGTRAAVGSFDSFYRMHITSSSITGILIIIGILCGNNESRYSTVVQKFKNKMYDTRMQTAIDGDCLSKRMLPVSSVSSS